MNNDDNNNIVVKTYVEIAYSEGTYTIKFQSNSISNVLKIIVTLN